MVIGAVGCSGQVIAAPTPSVDEGRITLPVIELGIVVLAVLAVWLFFARRWYRLPLTPKRKAPFSPAAELLLLAFIVFLGYLGTALAAQAWGISATEEGVGSTSDLAKLSLGRYAAQMTAVLVFFLVGEHHVSRSSKYGLAVILGVLGLALWWPITAAVNVLVGLLLMVLDQAPSDVGHETLQMLLIDDKGIWPVVVMLLVILAAPIIEEVMYRGLLQDAMRRLGLSPWIAIAATSAVFALMHWSAVEPNALVALFVLSLGFGWVFEKTGRLVAPIVMHALFNAGNLALTLLGS